MFGDPAQLPFVPRLEASWPAIRREYEALGAGDFAPWHERWVYDFGWNVMGLRAFERIIDDAEARCPETARALAGIPGLVTAGFSTLEPGAHIKPHRGYTSRVWRVHLGVDVPAGCELRVGAETRAWSEGRCLVFDDTTEHEAWNRGARRRAVLLLDVWKDPAHVPWRARAANDALWSVVKTVDTLRRWRAGQPARTTRRAT